MANVSLLYRYYFVRCSSELAQLVPLPFLTRFTRYSDILHDFSVTIPRYYNDFYVTFFSRTARFWNSLPIECFPVTYNLNGLKSRINRFFLKRFPVSFSLFVLLFLVTSYLAVVVQPYMEQFSI